MEVTLIEEHPFDDTKRSSSTLYIPIFIVENFLSMSKDELEMALFKSIKTNDEGKFIIDVD